jgi:hypothetical protein
MRLPRLLAILILVATGIASFALAAAGCGGTDPMQMGGDGGACMQRGTLTINQECATDCDCVDVGGVCTKTPYDRKPNPVCTLACDPANPEPRCTMGCNMKGYCKLP